MKVWFTPHGWGCDDIIWFMKNYKQIYHLSCMFMDGVE